MEGSKKRAWMMDGGSWMGWQGKRGMDSWIFHGFMGPMEGPTALLSLDFFHSCSCTLTYSYYCCYILGQVQSSGDMGNWPWVLVLVRQSCQTGRGGREIMDELCPNSYVSVRYVDPACIRCRP